jgi:hypothetical protein
VGDVCYRDPAQETFYGAVLPGTEGERREPDKALFSLVVDSINGTSWGAYSALLASDECRLGTMPGASPGPR